MTPYHMKELFGERPIHQMISLRTIPHRDNMWMKERLQALFHPLSKAESKISKASLTKIAKQRKIFLTSYPCMSFQLWQEYFLILL